MTDTVQTRLSRWKQKLIDQTLRNPLLNFRSNKVTTINIVDEKPTEIFCGIQLEGKQMTFRAAPEEASSASKKDAVEFSRYERDQLDGQYKDTSLQSDITADVLDLNLLRIFQKAVSLFEEQGFSSLCLSLGMLEWFEVDDSEARLKAPLILVPVQLLRETARSKFTLRATQDDPVLNPAIIEKLRATYRLTLPQLPDNYEDFKPIEYFAELQKIVAEQKGWRITEEIKLGFFAFQKFVMYKDLEIAEEIYAEHEIIRALCNDKTVLQPELDNEIEPDTLDEVSNPETTFQVVDADSSQQLAILAAKGGVNLVIEGPPGTGKSQTITNLIAETLAEGRTVLFVSEKMAALQVVYNRLEAAGLTDFCLQLHSNKTSKKSVYEELQRVLDSARPADHAADADLNRLSWLRSYLNEYAKELHKPFGKLNLTPYWAIGQMCQLEGAPIINSEIPNLAEVDKETFEQVCRNLFNYVQLILEIGPIETHPWKDIQLVNLSTAEQDVLYEAICQMEKLPQQLQQKCDSFAEEIGANRVISMGQAEMLCEIGYSLARSPGAPESLLMSSSWNSLSVDIAELLERGLRYKELSEGVLAAYKEQILEEDFKEQLKEYSDQCHKWYRLCIPEFWKQRRYFRSFFNPNYKPKSNTELIADLEKALQCKEDMLFVHEHDKKGEELFGDKWHGIDSDWKALKNFAEWIVSVRHFIVEEALSAKGISLAASGKAGGDAIFASVDQIRKLIDELRAKLSVIYDRGQFNKSSHMTARSKINSLSQWASNLKQNIRRIHEWIAFNQAKQACVNGPSALFFTRFHEQGYEPKLLEAAFRRCFFRRWLDLCFANRSGLANFQLSKHEQFIKEFRALDTRGLELAKQRLRYNVCHMRDTQLKSKDFEPELRILQRQIRARSKLPLRKLFKEIPAVIKAIKPCFMMSPLSAAQFIDSSNSPFDLVIFDEASQITSEDAVGSIVRGNQLVVVGDTKQLPPTNFFMAQVIEDTPIRSDGDERDELQIVDLESVLDECLASGFPSRRLKWHYRSRHESLIAFSNRKFYDGELLTFPARIPVSKSAALLSNMWAAYMRAEA